MRHKKAFMVFGIWVAAGALSLISPHLAAAGQTEGSCAVTATITGSDGARVVVDSAVVQDEVLTVPKTGTVAWSATMAGPPGAFTGSVKLVMPPPFTAITLGTWSGNSAVTSGAGTTSFTIPDAVPPGAQFRIVAEHQDANGVCSGFVNARIDGGTFSSPVSVAIAGGTILSAVGMALVTAPLWKAL